MSDSKLYADSLAKVRSAIKSTEGELEKLRSAESVLSSLVNGASSSSPQRTIYPEPMVDMVKSALQGAGEPITTRDIQNLVAGTYNVQVPISTLSTFLRRHNRTFKNTTKFRKRNKLWALA